MGVAAHNIGAAEARFGPAELRRLAAKLGVPLLSANVRDGSGQLVAEPVRFVSAAGRRVALVGVLSERYATAELQVSPPQQAVLEALRGVAGKYDAAIVLAYLPEDELRQLADALPEADVVVGGPTGQPISPKQIGPTLLASATNKGKFLARLDAPALGSADRWTGSIVELNEQFADDAQQMTNIEALPRGVGPARFRAAADRLCRAAAGRFAEGVRGGRRRSVPKVPRGGLPGVAEIETCRGLEIARSERGTRRSRLPALPHDRLRAAGRVCLGAAKRGDGERRLRKLPRPLASATCAKPDVHTPYFAQAKDHCTGCHDRENSPKFDYDKYWEKIRHGQKAKRGAAQ